MEFPQGSLKLDNFNLTYLRSAKRFSGSEGHAHASSGQRCTSEAQLVVTTVSDSQGLCGLKDGRGTLHSTLISTIDCDKAVATLHAPNVLKGEGGEPHTKLARTN